MYVKDAPQPPTQPANVAQISSSGAVPVIAPSGGGDVVGLGTTGHLMLWTDGPNSVAGDSAFIETVSSISLVGKNLGIGISVPNNTIQVANLISFDNTLFNTSLGFQAGTTITTGTLNVLVGYNAGMAITTSQQNVAVGYQALKANTVGNGNVAIGSQALAANITGALNTAVGLGALLANTIGAGNTCIGQGSLGGNISGDNSVAVGDSCLGASTTGTENTALGKSAMRLNTLGSENTASGRSALFANTTGNQNSAYGRSAGIGNTSGSNNIYLGFAAGGNVTTGSNNIILGYNISAPSATGSNQLSIGNLIFGTGIDGTGVGISSGNIGIGTIVPTVRLDVTGSIMFSSVLLIGANNTGLSQVSAGLAALGTGGAGSFAGSLKLTNVFTNNPTFVIRTNTTLTDGAAAALGTLLNAPAAGNPTKWIGIDDNGTTRFIPAW